MDHNKHRRHRFEKQLGNDRKTCHGCKLKLRTGEVYACCGGKYLLHKDCHSALVNDEFILLPFGPLAEPCLFLEKSGLQKPKCLGCEKDADGFVYHHFEKGWDFHPTCANGLKQRMEASTNEHRDGHEFELVGQGPNPYTCDGCRELGMGDRYKCIESGCNYLLHKKCFSALFEGRTIKNPLHPEADDCYFLEKSFLEDRRCVACRTEINGFVYHHFGEGWDFHPTCANLKFQMHVYNQKKPKISIFTLEEKLSANCFFCNQMGKGESWCYVSNDHQFHLPCLKMRLIDALVETETSRAMASRPEQYTLTEQKKLEFKKLKEFANIAGLILAALLGDPEEYSPVTLLIEYLDKKLG